MFEAGSVVVRILADSNALTAGLTRASGQVAAFGRQTSAVGVTLTKSLTLPLVGIAVVASKLAYDFEESMTKISALVGAGEHQMEQYRTAVLKLSGETAKAPRELGEALYFITSSGFKGAAALKVLTSAAKASAAGLGDTQVIAQAVGAAVNAYGEKNLSAAKATDVLLAAVREGTGEASEYAAAIGRVIPVAQVMGVSFGEVAGSMAALSLNGTDANEAVTQITAGLAQAIKPTKDGAEALKTIGMSYGDLRKVIADQGLLEAFDLLKEKFGGNVESIAKVFGNIRALRGALTLTGPAMEKYQGIIERVTKANGDTAKAFDKVAQTAGYKMRKALADLQVAGVNLGDKLLPAVAKIAGELSKLADKFSDLSPDTQRFIVKLGLAAAAAGPVLVMVGKLIVAFQTLRQTMLAVSATRVTIGAAGSLTMASGLAAAVTAGAGAAIAAATATVVVAGVKQGVEDARAKLDADSSAWQKWDTFWAGFFKGAKQGATDLSTWLDKALGGAGATEARVAYLDAVRAIDREMAKAWGNQKVRLADMKKDLDRAFELPDIKKALKLDMALPAAQLKQLRNLLVRELHIPIKEANALMKNLFREDYSREFGRNVTEKIDALKRKAKSLREEIAKRLRWGDLDVSDAQKKLSALKKQLAELTKQSGSTKLKLRLDEASLNWGGAKGGGATKGLIGQVEKLVGDAAKAGQSKAAAEGPAVGAALSSGIASGIAVHAADNAAASLVANAIAAARAAAESASPSKKMMRLGKWMVEGLVIGLTAKQAEAIAKASEVAGNILSAFESVLGMQTAITTMKEGGLFSVATGKAWAKKVAVRIKAMFAAMWKELRTLDLLDKEAKDKKGNVTTLPGVGQKFSAIAALANDIGSILSAFSEFTDESLAKALTAMASVKAKAKDIGKAIVAMAKALRDAMGKTLITEMTAGNASRAVQLASDLAGAIGTFVDLTDEKIGAGMRGLAGVVNSVRSISGLVVAVAMATREAFTGVKVEEAVASASSAASGMASDVAGVIGSFAELTADAISKAMTGITNVVIIAPQLGVKLVEMVNALKAPLMAVASDPAFTPSGEVASKVAAFVSDVTSVISSLAGMAPTGGETETDSEGNVATTPIIDVVKNAIAGAGKVSEYAVQLGSALLTMVGNLTSALGVLDVTSLEGLSGALGKLAEIASAIGDIVTTLAEMTAEKVQAATNAGSALGQGFYAGLLSWYAQIVELAQKIAADSAAALAGGAVASSLQLAAVPQASGGGTFSGPDSGYLVALHGTETVTKGPAPAASPVQIFIDARGSTDLAAVEASATRGALIGYAEAHRMSRRAGGR